jgi:hypothetical protein
MRKILSALAALGAVAALGLGFTSASPAVAAGGHASATHHAQRAALPWMGNYRGLDRDHRIVTFHYGPHGITNFRVGHQFFGHAQVQGDQWHHTCHQGYCTRGKWHHDFYVTGVWNISHGSSGDVFFEATHVG